jgi:hypothetical protein
MRRRVVYVDIGYMNDQNDRADLLSRLGLDYWSYLDKDFCLDLSKAGMLLVAIEEKKHLLDEIEDPDEKGYYLNEYAKFVRFVEREMGRDETAIQ